MRRIPLPNPTADPTMFDERPPQEYRAWALPLFLAVSLLGHVLAFYAFHVVYPTPQDVPQPTATLSLVALPEAGTSPRGGLEGDQRLLAGWLRESDPALLTTWQARVADWSRLDRGKYAPLYERWELQPELAAPGTPYTRQAEALSQAVRTESWDWRLGETPAPLEMAWLGIAPPPEEAPPAAPETVVTISPLAGADESAGAEAPTVLTPPAATLNLPAFRLQTEVPLASVQNAEFLVGSDATGRVLFTLTRRGSNSEDLDTAAAAYLRKLRLPPGETGRDQPSTTPTAGPAPDSVPKGPLRWWHARFAWGKEVFPP